MAEIHSLDSAWFLAATKNWVTVLVKLGGCTPSLTKEGNLREVGGEGEGEGVEHGEDVWVTLNPKAFRL